MFCTTHASTTEVLPQEVTLRRTVAGLVFATLVAGVSCTPAPAAVDTGAAQDALREADAAYSRAGNSKDLEAFVAHYAPEAVGYPPNEPTVTGLDGIRGWIGKALQDSAFAVTFQPVSLEVSSDGTMGYTVNTADLRATGPDGKPMDARIRDVHMWRKQADGSWKVVIDIWNFAP